MAQQAILRAHKHRREAKNAAASLGDCNSRPGSPSIISPAKDEDRQHLDDLRRALKSRSADLYRLFGIWDADSNGSLDASEFKRAIQMLGLRARANDFDAICALCDRNSDGLIDLEEASTRLSPAAPRQLVSSHLPLLIFPPLTCSPLSRLSCHPSSRQLTALIESTEASHEQTPSPPRNPLVRMLKGVYWFINLLSTQSVLYLAVVLIFQLLTDSLR